MKSAVEQVTGIFQSNGWIEVSLSEEMRQAGLDGIYVCKYAAAGVVFADDVSDIATRWANCQVQMSDLRDNQNVGTQKDLYLVFIIQELDMTAISILQGILNNTYVCRKICIEQNNGRSLEDALRDTPFFEAIGKGEQENVQMADIDSELEQNELPEKLQKYLANAKQSASKVLDSLLDGEYR